MISLYAWPTPNGRKAFIMLEELGLGYETHFININQQQQFAPAFLSVSPNNKIPAIVDHDAEGGALSIFESGAILTYLAERTGRFLPLEGAARWKTLEWLHWQTAGLGPMLGQFGYFGIRARDAAPAATERFTGEAARLIGVLERRLGEVQFLGGEAYSIADMAAYPWALLASTLYRGVLEDAFSQTPALTRWLAAVGERPAVARAMAISPG